MLEGVAPAELAQHDFVGTPAHVFRTHDFIGVTGLEHAVLVNTRSVCKRVGADHRLVGLHHKASGLADHATCRHDVLGVDRQIQVEVITTGFDGHDHFFQRAITSAFAQPVDGAFHLTRTTNHHAGQRVGYSHAQVVVAMHRPDGLVAIGNALTQRFDEVAVQLRNCVAHRIGHVDGGCALGDDCLQHTAQKIWLAAVTVLRAELDVGHQIAGKAYRLLGLLQHLLRSHAQLLLHVQRRRGDEGVNAR